MFLENWAGTMTHNFPRRSELTSSPRIILADLQLLLVLPNSNWNGYKPHQDIGPIFFHIRLILCLETEFLETWLKIVHRHYRKQKHSDRKQMENVYMLYIWRTIWWRRGPCEYVKGHFRGAMITDIFQNVPLEIALLILPVGADSECKLTWSSPDESVNHRSCKNGWDKKL